MYLATQMLEFTFTIIQYCIIYIIYNGWPCYLFQSQSIQDQGQGQELTSLARGKMSSHSHAFHDVAVRLIKSSCS